MHVFLSITRNIIEKFLLLTSFSCLLFFPTPLKSQGLKGAKTSVSKKRDSLNEPPRITQYFLTLIDDQNQKVMGGARLKDHEGQWECLNFEYNDGLKLEKSKDAKGKAYSIIKATVLENPSCTNLYSIYNKQGRLKFLIMEISKPNHAGDNKTVEKIIFRTLTITHISPIEKKLPRGRVKALETTFKGEGMQITYAPRGINPRESMKIQ